MVSEGRCLWSGLKLGVLRVVSVEMVSAEMGGYYIRDYRSPARAIDRGNGQGAVIVRTNGWVGNFVERTRTTNPKNSTSHVHFYSNSREL